MKNAITTNTKLSKGVPRSKNIIPRYCGERLIYYLRKKDGRERLMISTGIIADGSVAALRAAEKIANEKMREIQLAHYGYKQQEAPRSSTVGAWCDKHIDGHGATIAAASLSNLQYNSVHLRSTPVEGKTWEERDLRSITQSDCKQLLSALQRGTLKAHNTRRTFHGIAASIFQAAIGDGLLEKNPWDFKRAKPQPRERVLTIAEELLVREYLTPYYDRVMTVELRTGLRSNCELAKLKIEDIDQKQSRLFVRKGKGSKQRWVPAGDEVMQAIREQLAANDLGDPGTGKVSPKMFKRIEQGYVFPASSRAALDTWHRAAEKAGIEYFTSHDLRRTFATRWAEAGMPMGALKEVMGHLDIRVTEHFYAHLSESAVWMAMVAFNKAMKGAVEEAKRQVATGVVIPFEQSAK